MGKKGAKDDILNMKSRAGCKQKDLDGKGTFPQGALIQKFQYCIVDYNKKKWDSTKQEHPNRI